MWNPYSPEKLWWDSLVAGRIWQWERSWKTTTTPCYTNKQNAEHNMFVGNYKSTNQKRYSHGILLIQGLIHHDRDEMGKLYEIRVHHVSIPMVREGHALAKVDDCGFKETIPNSPRNIKARWINLWILISFVDTFSMVICPRYTLLLKQW